MSVPEPDAQASGAAEETGAPGGGDVVAPHGFAAFVRFVAGGVFNAGTCVLFSQGWYLLLGLAVPSFVLGYALSLTLSYFVNAILVFRHDRLSVRGFALFCLSYVPNFVIQFVLVTAMVEVIGVPPFWAFVLGVGLAVPVTFLILARFTFRPGATRSR